MSTYILTSMFPNRFMQIAKVFQQKIEKRDKFAFVASEFEALHEKTDKYFRIFLDMFEEAGIHFEEAHFVRENVSDELIELSNDYIIYGLCDDALIVCSGEMIEFYGEVYKLSKGIVKRI